MLVPLLGCKSRKELQLSCCKGYVELITFYYICFESYWHPRRYLNFSWRKSHKRFNVNRGAAVCSCLVASQFLCKFSMVTPLAYCIKFTSSFILRELLQSKVNFRFCEEQPWFRFVNISIKKVHLVLLSHSIFLGAFIGSNIKLN